MKDSFGVNNPQNFYCQLQKKKTSHEENIATQTFKN